MTKVKTVRMCKSEGCTFTTTSVKELQKHYELDHDMKERVKGSLVISGHDYLPISGKPIHHKEKFLAGAIFVLLGFFMITAPSLNLIYAADEQGSSGDSGGGGSDGGDSGGDSGGGSNDNSGGDSEGGGGDNSNDNSGDNSNDNSQDQQKDETKPDESDSSNNNNNEVIDREKLKGTPEEQEAAAVEDYIHEEPGIVKPYPSMGKISDKPTPGSISNPKINLRCSHLPEGCSGKGKGDGWSGDGWKKGGGGDCKNKWTHECKHDWNDNGNNWCKWHKCGDGGHHSKGDHNHHHNHGHNYHNDKHHYDSHTNKYYYYYSNDYSNNHATVILQLDYHGTNDVHDVNIEIGNDFDATFNLAGEPENLVITGLDLDNGENFDVCIENDGNVNCEKGHINNQNDVDYVDIRVP